MEAVFGNVSTVCVLDVYHNVLCYELHFEVCTYRLGLAQEDAPQPDLLWISTMFASASSPHTAGWVLVIVMSSRHGDTL